MAFSHLVWELPNVFMHNLPDKKFKHSYVTRYGSDWLAGIIVNHSLDLSHKFRISFLMRTIRGRLLNYCSVVITIILIQLFLSPLHCPQIDAQILWNLCVETYRMNANQSHMLFPSFWHCEFHHGATFPTDSAQLILIYCIVDKTRSK